MFSRTTASTTSLFLGLYLLSLLISPVASNTLTKRARNWQCGQVKSNDKLYPNQCLCFDALGTTAVAGQSQAQVTYANLNGFGYPQSVSDREIEAWTMQRTIWADVPRLVGVHDRRATTVTVLYQMGDP